MLLRLLLAALIGSVLCQAAQAAEPSFGIPPAGMLAPMPNAGTAFDKRSTTAGRPPPPPVAARNHPVSAPASARYRPTQRGKPRIVRPSVAPEIARAPRASADAPTTTASIAAAPLPEPTAPAYAPTVAPAPQTPCYLLRGVFTSPPHCAR